MNLYKAKRVLAVRRFERNTGAYKNFVPTNKRRWIKKRVRRELKEELRNDVQSVGP